MLKLLHGFYNMDTNSVELTYSDGSVLTIDCEEVENFYNVTNSRLTWIGWFTIRRWSMPGWWYLENWSAT